jgi:hypothetical protein
MTAVACRARRSVTRGYTVLLWQGFAAAFLDDLRRIDAQLLDVKKKLTAAVRASGTTLTAIFGSARSPPPP